MYGFATDDGCAGTAALLVYVTWRSRDKARLKITPNIWAQVERFVRSSAKRATTLPEFLDRLKPRLQCRTLQPRWCSTTPGSVDVVAGEEDTTPFREFLVGVLGQRDEVVVSGVLGLLYKETGYVIALVRERLEREKDSNGGTV